MDATLRETRIGNIRMKIAVCQQDCLTLAAKSSSPDLPPEEKAEISHFKEATIRQCDYYRYMLGLYEERFLSSSCTSSCIVPMCFSADDRACRKTLPDRREVLYQGRERGTYAARGSRTASRQ